MSTNPLQLEDWLKLSPYQGYTYAYPHKSAYRPLSQPLPLRTVWAGEPRDALFLYLHIPFCEMRCGFCNLFTTANPKTDLASCYLQALQRQARRVREALGAVRFASMALGGGTPTFLDLKGLETLFDLAADLYGIDLATIPLSCETSPRTAEPEKLRLLRERGVKRLSIGIQSFLEAETRAVGRVQKPEWIAAALEAIRAIGFPTLNLDLIYGLPGQSVETWLASLQAALRYCPEEIYLYPLYNRPLTGLDRMGTHWQDVRLDCYRAGRELLRSEGYAQVSMRMFRKPFSPPAALETQRHRGNTEKNVSSPSHPPSYRCQEDGMIGLGCGARSYTRTLHYSSEYAVSRTGVRGILADYIGKSEEEFAVADYGFVLDADEQRRRYVLMSLLQAEGLNLALYRQRFGSNVLEDLPELKALEEHGLAERRDNSLFRLTAAGLERSDTIGPWLTSQKVRALMQEYELR